MAPESSGVSVMGRIREGNMPAILFPEAQVYLDSYCLIMAD